MDTLHLQRLLSEISTKTKVYEKQAELSGENFNIFKILRLTSNEVRTHSAFIAELLNPKGSHGLDDIFLKHFLSLVPGIVNFDPIDAEVTIEKHIGEIDKEYSQGGRIDIVITSSTGEDIIIENKIYAGNTKNQLFRYYNYAIERHRDKHERYHILFLTLFGDKPGKDSTCGHASLEEKCMSISYEKLIVQWLELCLKETSPRPSLRESIIQYIHLIKSLTNQSTNKAMEKETLDLILSTNENIDAVIKIGEATNSIKLEIIKRFLDSLNDSREEIGFDLIYSQKDKMGYPETNFKFRKSEKSRLNVSFEFENYDKLFIGISLSYKDSLNMDEKMLMHNKMKTTMNFGEAKKSDGWPWFTYYKEWENATWYELLNHSFKKKMYRDILAVYQEAKDLME